MIVKLIVGTYAKERRQYGEVSRTEASRFLHELPQDDLSWELSETKKSQEHKEKTAKMGVASMREMLKNKKK